VTSDTSVLPAPSAPPAPAPVGRRGWWRQLGIDTGYVLAGFPLSIVAFVVVLPGLALGAALLVVWVGLPVLVLTLFASRGFATAERVRLPAVLRQPLPRPGLPAGGPRPGPGPPGCWSRSATRSTG
jgi:putative sensor protein